MRRADISPKSIALLLAGGLLLYGLYSSIEFYDDTVEGNWSLQALINPYLAAEKFIGASGIEVTGAVSLTKLDSLDGITTLFISDSGIVTNRRQLDQVLDWLDGGGNIILSANSVDDGEDLLMQEFDLGVRWLSFSEQDDDSDSDSDSDSDGEFDARPRQSIGDRLREYNRKIEEGMSKEDIASILKPEVVVTGVGFGDDIGDLEIAFHTSLGLQHPYIDDGDYDDQAIKPNSWSSSERGIHLIQFNVGAGLFTVVSDASIWTSQRIDEFDHAYLLWILMDKTGEFAVLRQIFKDSLWSLARQHGFELLIAALVTLLIWLWYLGHRFGRITPQDSSMSRALGEHFLSVTAYLWKRKRTDYLLASLRQRVLRKGTLHIGEFARADEARQIELLAKRSNCNPDSVQRALHQSEFTESTFVTTVKLLKHIEQSL